MRSLAAAGLVMMAGCAEREWFAVDPDPRSAIVAVRAADRWQLSALDGPPIEVPRGEADALVLLYDRPASALDVDRDAEGQVVLADRAQGDARVLPTPRQWLRIPADGDAQGGTVDALPPELTDVRVRAAPCGALVERARGVAATANLPSFLVSPGTDVLFTETYAVTGSVAWPKLVRATPAGVAPVAAVPTSSMTTVLSALVLPDRRVAVLSGRAQRMAYVELTAEGTLVHRASASTPVSLARWAAARIDGDLWVIVTDVQGALWRLDRETGALRALLGPHVDRRCENEASLQPLALEDTGRLVYGRSGAVVAVASVRDATPVLAPLIDEDPRVACRGTYARDATREALWIEEPRVGLDMPASFVWWRTPVASSWVPQEVVASPSLELTFVDGRLALPQPTRLELWAHTEGTAKPRACDVVSLGGTTRKAVAVGPTSVATAAGHEAAGGGYVEVVFTWFDVR